MEAPALPLPGRGLLQARSAVGPAGSPPAEPDRGNPALPPDPMPEWQGRGTFRWSQHGIGVAVLVVSALLVLYPLVFLVAESFNVGDPQVFPPEEIGLANYAGIGDDVRIIINTLRVSVEATAVAIIFGFLLAWTLTRTNLPGQRLIERLLELPYYVTPLVGALAWAILAAPRSGFINQMLSRAGIGEAVLNIYSPEGVAWIMALFEGSVAFVMVSAAMKSMDPAMEEAARVLGAGKLRTMLGIVLPLVLPGLLGATVFVFAEMMGSFAAALVVGMPGHFYVITTAIWEVTSSYPPDYGRAAALGISLFVIMFAMMAVYRWIVARGSYATISGKAFRPRRIDMGPMRWVLFGFICFYIAVSVALPMGALILTSFERFATVIVGQMQFTLANYYTAFSLASVRSAIGNSLLLGIAVASVGVLVMLVLVWVIYRSATIGRGAIEYVVMFPQAVPRMVFGLALLWAWLNIPIPIYGTLWLLALAYFTVLLPLGVRTLGGVILQVDKSLEECARVCGASWVHQMRTVTMPLLRPGILSAWLLLFIASVRELGASIYLMGPNSKVIAPAIVGSWSNSGTELTAAMAMIQTVTVVLAVVLVYVVSRDRRARDA